MKLGLFGRGRLGAAIAEEAGASLVWQVGREAPPEQPVTVAVEASAAEAVAGHLDWALETGTDLVIGATGWELPGLEARIAGRIGVLVAPNFSLTVALMARLALVLGRYAAEDDSRDPFLVEHHHRLKADAPSGTAKTLAAALMAGCPRKTAWTLGPAAPHQLSLGVVRAGSEFGTHLVGLDAPAEVLTLTHQARSRVPFAQGALAAARWLQGRRGIFTMEDLAADRLDRLFADLGTGVRPPGGAGTSTPPECPQGASGPSPKTPSTGDQP